MDKIGRRPLQIVYGGKCALQLNASISNTFNDKYIDTVCLFTLAKHSLIVGLLLKRKSCSIEFKIAHLDLKNCMLALLEHNQTLSLFWFGLIIQAAERFNRDFSI